MKNKRKIPTRASRGMKWENKMYKLKRSIDHCLMIFFCYSLVPLFLQDKGKKWVCSGGKNTKGTRESCVESTRSWNCCPCVGMRALCSRDCRWKGRKKVQKYLWPRTSEGNVSRKCGVDKIKRDIQYMAYTDGERKTNWPCVCNNTWCRKKLLLQKLQESMPNSSVMTSSPLKRKHENVYQFKNYICWVGHGLLINHGWHCAPYNRQHFNVV